MQRNQYSDFFCSLELSRMDSAIGILLFLTQDLKKKKKILIEWILCPSVPWQYKLTGAELFHSPNQLVLLFFLTSNTVYLPWIRPITCARLTSMCMWEKW